MRFDHLAQGLLDTRDIPAIADYAHSGSEVYSRREVHDTPLRLVHKRCLAKYRRDEGITEDEPDPVLVLAESARPTWAGLEVIAEDIEDLRHVPLRTLAMIGCTNEDSLEHIIKEA